MLAVGLGIGAAVASSPGIASADSATDPFNFLAGLDPLSGADSAAAADPFGIYISADGMTLLDLGEGAFAHSGAGDLAIAIGYGSFANATGGFGDSAIATDGASAYAGATLPIGATGSNFNFADAEGEGTRAFAGGGSFDSASAASGTNTDPDDGAFADAGAGSNDSASAVGQGVAALAGQGDAASGNFANFDSANVFGNLSHTADITAQASQGNFDNAFIVDPFGTVGSSAMSGGTFFHNFDLAGVFGDDLHAMANTGSNLVEILPSLFGESAAATDVGSFLTDIGSGLFSF